MTPEELDTEGWSQTVFQGGLATCAGPCVNLLLRGWRSLKSPWTAVCFGQSLSCWAPGCFQVKVISWVDLCIPELCCLAVTGVTKHKIFCVQSIMCSICSIGQQGGNCSLPSWLRLSGSEDCSERGAQERETVLETCSGQSGHKLFLLFFCHILRFLYDGALP